jgi:uncharacterized RDD family membrane protein YckC
MENEFAKIMSDKSDEELVKILTAERDKYNPKAIEAADSEVDKRNIDTSKFQQIKEKTTAERVVKEKVDSSVVGSGTRLLHLIIDLIACSIAANIVLFIAGFFLTSTNDLYLQFLTLFLFFGTFFAYYAIMEIKFQKTLGKFITNTKVVKMNGEKPENSDIIVRTFCRFVPFDQVTFLFMKNGIHDFLSKTKVIKDGKIN